MVEEVASVIVELYPPNTKAELDSQEIEDLVEILHKVVIYKEDNSYAEYAGQGVSYEITKTDGTITRIIAYNPFVIIDGVGYKRNMNLANNLIGQVIILGDTKFFLAKELLT